MGIQRLDQSVSWQVDEFAELSEINDGELRHGDDAYVIGDDTWYKYNKYYGTWQLMTASAEE